MIRLKKDSRDGGGGYNYNLQNFIDGFGSVDWAQPYWFGLKNMKKITSESTVDLFVAYTEGGVERYDTFHNFVVKDDVYRMSYANHKGTEGGGRYFYRLNCCTGIITTLLMLIILDFQLKHLVAFLLRSPTLPCLSFHELLLSKLVNFITYKAHIRHTLCKVSFYLFE